MPRHADSPRDADRWAPLLALAARYRNAADRQERKAAEKAAAFRALADEIEAEARQIEEAISGDRI